MKTTTFEDRDLWMQARLGKITGSKLKGLVVKRGTEKKIGFYELIAERLLKPLTADGIESYSSAMARGSLLEGEAMDEFVKHSGLEVDRSLILWERDDNDDIAVSPDGVVGDTEAVEIKCLASARHLEAYLTQMVPDEYYFQALQYFIVNEKLKKLHFSFYDPRLIVKQIFVIEMKREDVEVDVANYLDYQRRELAEVELIVKQLSTPHPL